MFFFTALETIYANIYPFIMLNTQSCWSIMKYMLGRSTVCFSDIRQISHGSIYFHHHQQQKWWCNTIVFVNFVVNQCLLWMTNLPLHVVIIISWFCIDEMCFSQSSMPSTFESSYSIMTNIKKKFICNISYV